MGETLTAGDVLSAGAHCDYSTEVRSIGPCVVFVVELDAPLRGFRLTHSPADALALGEWLRENRPAHELAFAFAKGKALEEASGGGSDLDMRHRKRLARDAQHQTRLDRAEGAPPAE